MNILAQYIKKTQQLKKHLEKDWAANERDANIKLMEQLLEERREYLQDFPDLSSLEDRHKKQLAQLETELQTLMNEKLNAIKQDIKTLYLKKNKGNQYNNPYENVSIDGTFLDKKK